MSSPTIALIGAFDTKATENAFVRECLLRQDVQVLTINTGVLGTTDLFPVDIEANIVSQAAGISLSRLRNDRDRGAAMRVMSEGAAIIARQLHREGRFQAIVGMGGTGGTSVVSAAMRALPFGVPKLCVSTTAAGDVSPYVGTADITMMPSIVDVAGLNRISRDVFTRAAAAIVGMARTPAQPVASADRPLIAASMFGNTTDCVNRCVSLLDGHGYETLVFHATGSGGRTMERLAAEGLVEAVLDITTTEWADELCGGVFRAGPTRLDAAGSVGLPHLIVPGCIDMVNFGGPASVPATYRDAGRLFYEWNPSVTLMRTNAEENTELGRIFAAKANAARGPVAFLLPLRGVSILDGDGERFCDRAADQAFFDALRTDLLPDIPVHEVDANINDPAFADRAVSLLLALIAARTT